MADSSDRVEAIREFVRLNPRALSNQAVQHLLRLHDEDQARIAAFEQLLAAIETVDGSSE